MIIRSGSLQVNQGDYKKAWLVAARGISGTSPIPDPPQYKKCAEGLAKLERKLGEKVGSKEARKLRCRQSDAALKQQTLDSLIYQLWIKREAQKKNIVIGDEEIDRQRDLLANSYGKKLFSRYLNNVDASDEQVNQRIRQQLTEEKLINDLKIPGRLKDNESQLREMYRQLKEQINARSFASAKPELKLILRSINADKGRPQLKINLARLYRQSTICADGYIINLCDNWRVVKKEQLNDHSTEERNT